jgi:hypothetical protein
MDLAEAADALYALPRDEFTPARGELVTQVRADGDRELAGRIGALRRPTVAAWLVNQLARQRPGELDALTALGARLRRAHEELDGAALRELSQERRALLDRLAGTARELGAAAGVGVSEPVSRELDEMFGAGLAEEAAGRALLAGRLHSAKALTEAPADGAAWPAPAAGARPRPTLVRSGPPSEPAPPDTAVGSREEPAERGPSAARRRLRAELDRLEEALAALDERHAEADRSYQEASAEETEAHREVARRRAALVSAEEAEQRARQRARFARRTREDAERDRTRAARRTEVARERLAALQD